MLKGRQHSRSNVLVRVRSDGERGAYAARPFNPGDFVCEYAACVKKTKDSKEEDNMYQTLGVGCYCLDAVYNGEKITFDATATINDPGRYINHASKNQNLQLMQPIFVAGKVRIGFVAKTTICKGDELYFDYGIRRKDIVWLTTDAKKPLKTEKTEKFSKMEEKVNVVYTVLVHIKRHTKQHTYIYMYKHTYNYTTKHTYAQTYIHTNMCIISYTTHIGRRTHARTHTHTHSHILPVIHMHTHTH